MGRGRDRRLLGPVRAPAEHGRLRSAATGTRSDDMNTFARRAATGVLPLVGLVALRVADSRQIRLPACPFKALTGHDCVGCGSTRSLTQLAHGDVADAFDFNVLVPVAVALLLVSWVAWLLEDTRLKFTPLLSRRRAAVGVLAVTAAFWALRLTDTPLGQYLGSTPT